MIKAQILIEMKDGSLYTYANHFLEEKDADLLKGAIKQKAITEEEGSSDE